MCKNFTVAEINKRVQFTESKGVKLTSPFTAMKKPHDWVCTDESCNHAWSATFDNMYSKSLGCPKCNIAKRGLKFRISKSQLELYVTKMKSRNIILISEFTRTNDYSTFRCLISNCSHEWTTKLSMVVHAKTGCPSCARNVISDSERIKRDVELEVRHIKIISEIKSVSVKHCFRCLKSHCLHEWTTTLSSVYGGTGCPRCIGKVMTEKEKINMKAHNILRSRLSTLYRKGKLKGLKMHHDDEVLNIILPYWEAQYRLCPIKPELKGKWQLDHIIPVSWFDFNDIEQLKLCWNHKNFRWLTQHENISRSNKMRTQDLEILTDWHYSAINKASYAKLIPSAVC